MRYPAMLTPDGRDVQIEFPDCPGCQTFASPGEDPASLASEALSGWLEVALEDGEAPPRPSSHPHVARGSRLLWVTVPTQLGVALSVRWVRQDAGLTQAQLARKVGVSQQQVAKLEDPEANLTLSTLVKVAEALGAEVDVAVRPHHAAAISASRFSASR